MARPPGGRSGVPQSTTETGREADSIRILSITEKDEKEAIITSKTKKRKPKQQQKIMTKLK